MITASRDISPRGVKFIAGWEQFVPWVYDDFAKPVRMTLDGKNVLIPPRWIEGSPVRGTLTFGFGHTDVAKHPMKCKDLMARKRDLTIDEAYDILHTDLYDCVRNVNRMVKVPLTQSQADALYSITFNFGEGNLKKSSILAKLNRGDYNGARAAFDLYVKSKGKFMQGLQNRRDAEQKLWDEDGKVAAKAAFASMDDDMPEALADAPAPTPRPDVFVETPKDVDPATAKSMATSKIGNTQIITGGLTATGAAASVAKSVFDTGTDTVEHVTEVVNQSGQVVDQVRTITQAVPDKSTLTSVLNFLTDPVVVAVIATAVVLLCGFAWWERRKHVREGDF